MTYVLASEREVREGGPAPQIAPGPAQGKSGAVVTHKFEATQTMIIKFTIGLGYFQSMKQINALKTKKIG